MNRPEHLPPERNIIGRRPQSVRWTPSSALPWWFGSFADDRRFTLEQERTLISMGRDPVTAEGMAVIREAPGSEVWVPHGAWRPVYVFECPVIGKGRRKMVRIIGPDGNPKDIRPDGWTREPSTEPVKQGFY